MRFLVSRAKSFLHPQMEAFLKSLLPQTCRNVSGVDHNSSSFRSFAITQPFAFKIADLLTLLLTLDNRSDFFSSPLHVAPLLHFSFTFKPRLGLRASVKLFSNEHSKPSDDYGQTSRMCITLEWPRRPSHTPKVSCKAKTCVMQQQKAVSKRFVLHVSCVLTHLGGFFVRWRDDRFSTAIRKGIQEATIVSRAT